MKKRVGKETTIDKIVKNVIENLSGKGRISEEEIAQIWREAVGEKMARHTRPVSIRKSVLLVNVDGSGWLYELTVKKRDILKKLEGKFKGKQLKGLRFRIGEIMERHRAQGAGHK